MLHCSNFEAVRQEIQAQALYERSPKLSGKPIVCCQVKKNFISFSITCCRQVAITVKYHSKIICIMVEVKLNLASARGKLQLPQ